MSKVSALDVLGAFCQRPRLLCPNVETAADVLAGLYGICMGFGNPTAETCLASLPGHVQSTLAHHAQDTWLESLRSASMHMTLSQTLDLIGKLIDDWKMSRPDMPLAVAPPVESCLDAFELMEDLFRRPTFYMPKASTLRELVSFLDWYLRIRWPAHGYVPDCEELNLALCNRFSKSEILGWQRAALCVLQETPFDQACTLLADAILEWSTASGMRALLVDGRRT